MPTAAGCGRKRMSLAAPYFSSPCPARTRSSRVLLARLACPERRTKTPNQMLLINRLTKVTNDPIIQGPGAINVIGVGSNKNCRNFVSCRDKVSVQLDAGHRGHMHVGDQARRFNETRGSEE